MTITPTLKNTTCCIIYYLPKMLMSFEQSPHIVTHFFSLPLLSLNLWFSGCFQGVLNGNIGLQWVKNRSSHRSCFIKKVFLIISQNSQENMCQSLFLNKVTNFTKKETLAQVLSKEFCDIFKNFSTEHVWATASVKRKHF